MATQFGCEAVLSVVLTVCLLLPSTPCHGEEIKGSMYSSSMCKTPKVFWLSEKANAIITGKSDDRPKDSCKIIFGLATDNKDARLKINFDFIYVHDCGVRLQINQSTSSRFDSVNSEMFMSGCYFQHPGPLYAQPKNYILLSLSKTDRRLQAFNFRLNISVADELPSTGPALHAVIITTFVCVVVVVVASVLLLKYAVRVSYRWSEERREQAIERAVNLYNSSEPLEEPDLVYIQHGGSASSSSHSGSGGRGKHQGGEIAFVHSNGRIDRFRPLANHRPEDAAGPSASSGSLVQQQGQLQRPKPQKCRVNTSEDGVEAAAGGGGGGAGRGRRQAAAARSAASTVTRYPHIAASQAQKEARNLADAFETASLGGVDLPPSYEEALDMPPPEAEGVRVTLTESLERLEGAVGGSDEVAAGLDGTTSTESGGAPDKRKRKGSSSKSEELIGPDSQIYMNIDGRLEILGHDVEDEESVGEESATSQQPLLHEINPAERREM